MSLTFGAKLDDSTALKKALAVVGELVDVGNFVATAEGLSFQAMDGSHVCVADLSIPAACFSDYALAAGSVVFGVRLGALNRALGCSIAGKELGLAVSDDKLELSFAGATFEVPLCDIESSGMDLVPPAEGLVVDVDAGEFQKILKDLASFGDVVGFSSTSTGGINMSTSGDYGKALARVPGTVVRGADVRAHFAAKYLVTFGKAAGAADVVRLSTSESTPLFVIYDLRGGGTLTFVIAPKIDDDDDDDDV